MTDTISTNAGKGYCNRINSHNCMATESSVGLSPAPKVRKFWAISPRHKLHGCRRISLRILKSINDTDAVATHIAAHSEYTGPGSKPDCLFPTQPEYPPPAFAEMDARYAETMHAFGGNTPPQLTDAAPENPTPALQSNCHAPQGPVGPAQ